MPLAAINAYLGQLPGLLAEWRLQLMEATMLPHLKTGARRRAVDETRDLAYGGDEERVVIKASPTMLAMLGIGIRMVGVKHG